MKEAPHSISHKPGCGNCQKPSKSDVFSNSPTDCRKFCDGPHPHNRTTDSVRCRYGNPQAGCQKQGDRSSCFCTKTSDWFKFCDPHPHRFHDAPASHQSSETHRSLAGTHLHNKPISFDREHWSGMCLEQPSEQQQDQCSCRSQSY